MSTDFDTERKRHFAMLKQRRRRLWATGATRRARSATRCAAERPAISLPTRAPPAAALLDVDAAPPRRRFSRAPSARRGAAQKREAQLEIKRRAARVAREVKSFWTKIDRVVALQAAARGRRAAAQDDGQAPRLPRAPDRGLLVRAAATYQTSFETERELAAADAADAAAAAAGRAGRGARARGGRRREAAPARGRARVRGRERRGGRAPPPAERGRGASGARPRRPPR